MTIVSVLQLMLARLTYAALHNHDSQATYARGTKRSRPPRPIWLGMPAAWSGRLAGAEAPHDQSHRHGMQERSNPRPSQSAAPPSSAGAAPGRNLRAITEHAGPISAYTCLPRPRPPPPLTALPLQHSPVTPARSSQNCRDGSACVA